MFYLHIDTAQAFRIFYETVKNHLKDYNNSKKLKPENGGSQKHIPPCSPNLNPIEGLWKIINEFARNNRVFKRASEFR